MDYSDEEWKPVVGYEGFYEVSSKGRVCRIIDTWGRPIRRMKRFWTNRRGYLMVQLYRGSHQTRKHYSVHQLVARVFIGPCPHGKEVNHLDFNKVNNHVSNLEYLTPPQNKQHAVEHGQIARGSRNGTAILSEDDVVKLRLLFAGGMTAEVLGKRFGVSKYTIYRAVQRKGWKHVS